MGVTGVWRCLPQRTSRIPLSDSAVLASVASPCRHPAEFRVLVVPKLPVEDNGACGTGRITATPRSSGGILSPSSLSPCNRTMSTKLPPSGTSMIASGSPAYLIPHWHRASPARSSLFISPSFAASLRTSWYRLFQPAHHPLQFLPLPGPAKSVAYIPLIRRQTEFGACHLFSYSLFLESGLAL